MSITALLENLAIARSGATYLRYRDKLAKFDLIIIDEMGMRNLTATEAQDLCEIIEERSINKAQWSAPTQAFESHRRSSHVIPASVQRIVVAPKAGRRSFPHVDALDLLLPKPDLARVPVSRARL
jgi:DNA replication protein DnaC